MVADPRGHLGQVTAGEDGVDQLALDAVAPLEQGEHLADVTGWQLTPTVAQIVGKFSHAGDATGVVGSAG